MPTPSETQNTARDTENENSLQASQTENMAQKISRKKNKKGRGSKGNSINRHFDREKFKKIAVKERARILDFYKSAWPNKEKD